MNLFNKNAILKKARIQLDKGDFSDGLLFLKKEKYNFFLINKSSFLKSEYFFLYGAFLTNNGYHKRAIAYLKKALFNPNLDKSEILYYIIFSYVKLNNHKKTIYYFNKITERTFNSFYILLSYYICIKNKLNLNISLNSIKEIIPDSSELFIDALSISLYHLLDNKYNLSYNLLKSYYNKYNDNFFYNLIILKTLFKTKKYDDILNYFEKNSQYLINTDTLFIYAATLYKIKLFDQCIKILNEILFIDKNNIKAIINLGKIYFTKGKHILAINYFKNALKKYPDNYKDEILFYLSICYQHIGLLNDTLFYLKKISIDSDFYNFALFNLSLLHYDLSNYNNAKDIFSQINKEKISKKLYNKWEKRINNITNKMKKIKILNNIIFFIPWLLLIFSILVLLIFYFMVKF